jgi:hypothetical protein
MNGQIIDGWIHALKVLAARKSCGGRRPVRLEEVGG